MTEKDKKPAPKSLPENAALDSEAQKAFTKKVKELKASKPSEGPGVVYVGHIPHGFYEEQMTAYFSQFGTVEKLRISRSKRTGQPKGYAFVQFKSASVAKIVADTMNNYLMFNRLLKCELLPLERIHPNTFKGANRPFKKPKSHVYAAARNNKTKSAEKLAKNVSRMKKRKSKSLARLAAAGISFEYPGVVKVDGNASVSMDSESTSTSDVVSSSSTKDLL